MALTSSVDYIDFPSSCPQKSRFPLPKFSGLRSSLPLNPNRLAARRWIVHRSPARSSPKEAARAKSSDTTSPPKDLAQWLSQRPRNARHMMKLYINITQLTWVFDITSVKATPISDGPQGRCFIGGLVDLWDITIYYLYGNYHCINIQSTTRLQWVFNI